MANAEQGGNPETPLQKRIRETREFIRKVMGQIDSDAQKTEEQKNEEKEKIAKTSQEELKRQVEKHENVPEGRRDHDKAAEDVMTSVNELAELIKHKAIRNLPVIAASVVEALAKKSISPRKAILLGKIVNDIVESPEFRATSEAAEELVKEKLRGLAASLRGEDQHDIADTIDEQIQAAEQPPTNEPPKPPESPPQNPDTPGSPERGEDGEEREPIEEKLNKHYRLLKPFARDSRTGEMVEGGEDWLEIEEQKKGGIYGLSAELQRSLLGIAIRSQIDLTRRQRVILRAFDGGIEFKTYFNAMREMLTEKPNADGTPRTAEASVNEVYKAMSNDIKDVVRELLSALSGTVDSHSQKESQYISLLVDRISRNIRTEIAGDTDMDIPGSIKLEGTDAMVPMAEDTTTGDKDNPFGSKEGLMIGGMSDYLVPRDVRASMSEALVDDLAATLTKLQKITVGFHNARAYAYSGGSHKDFGEQLKKDGIKPADLVWTFKKEDDVNLAYNLFIQSLQQLKSQTGRTITERYGAMSKLGGLTEAEYRAYIQLLALDDKYREAEEGYRIANEDGNNKNAKLHKKAMDRIKQKKMRAIKMASGIAWGHSRESWGVLLDAKLLIKRKGKGTEDEPYHVGQHYGGSQSSGIEKMLAELHPNLNDDRWGREKMSPMWMLYQHRDLDAAETGWKDKEPFSHTRLYDLYHQHQDAFYRGRSDDLADFDDEYITAHEFANVTSLHMLRREGWRLRQYELYLNQYKREAQESGEKGKDLHEYMMKRLMVRGGPRLVKMYIDKNAESMAKDDKSIDGSLKRKLTKGEKVEHIEEVRGVETTGMRKALAEARKAKQKVLEEYYAKYIFDDIAKRFTTSLIALEQPRYMPEGEKTLYERLNRFIEGQPFLQNLPANILQTEIYPIYIDAIHTVERNAWEKMKSKKGTKEEQVARQTEEPRDLTEADFDDPDIKEKLRTHYKLNQERMGELTEDKYKLEADFEEYFASLKKFHRELKSARDDNKRYNRVRGRNKKRQTLSQRYAHMLAIDQGGVNHALGGSYFDFAFEFQQGGVDAINRLSSDVNKSAEMTEAWNELTGEEGALEEFAKSAAKDEEEIEHGAKEVAKAIAKVIKYPHSFSPHMGNMYRVRHEIFWARAFAKPEVYRGLLGPIHEINSRNTRGGRQSSLLGEYYQRVYGRTDHTALDADGIRTFCNTLEHVLDIPPTKFEAAEFESVSDMNAARRTLRRAEDAMRHIPIIGPSLRSILRSTTSSVTEAKVKHFHFHEYNQAQALRELGARKRDVFREKALSIDSLVAVFGGLFAYFKAAGDTVGKGGGGKGGGGGGHGH